MNLEPNQEPFAVFLPDLRRFLVIELWSVVLTVGTGVMILYSFRGLSYSWLLTAIALGLLGVLYHATFSRRSRRIVIGDTWISGPKHESSESTTMQFDMVDWARSGFRRGRLRFRSMSGQVINAKTFWYAPEDIEEIKRLVRDRCHAAQLPASFY